MGVCADTYLHMYPWVGARVLGAVFRSFFKGGKVDISRSQGGRTWMRNLLSDLGWPFQGGEGGGALPPCPPSKYTPGTA